MPKAIVFDFGNVLYDLDFKLFFKNLTSLLEEDLSSGYPPFLVDVVHDYESGQIDTETFISKIQDYKKGVLDPESIINCWNSMLKGIPENRWQFLSNLKSQYKLFLLSNINELHLNVVYNHINKIHGKVDFESDYFDAVFYSHLIKMRKPNNDIYLFVEENIGMKGKEILFIDDNAENIESAKKIGWNAIHHNPKYDIVDCFEDYLQSI